MFMRIYHISQQFFKSVTSHIQFAHVDTDVRPCRLDPGASGIHGSLLSHTYYLMALEFSLEKKLKGDMVARGPD